MPRVLRFKQKKLEIEAQLQVFSRDIIYGKKSIEKRSKEGELYQQANLTSDGTHIVTSGGVNSTYLDSKGNNISKTKLVGDLGNELPMTKSMFSSPIVLEESISVRDYFRYDIERTYLLISKDLEALLNQCNFMLERNRLLKFPYAYYDTTDIRDAILIPKGDKIFVAVGSYEEPIMLRPTEIFPYDELLEAIEEEIEFEVW